MIFQVGILLSEPMRCKWIPDISPLTQCRYHFFLEYLWRCEFVGSGNLEQGLQTTEGKHRISLEEEASQELA